MYLSISKTTLKKKKKTTKKKFHTYYTKHVRFYVPYLSISVTVSAFSSSHSLLTSPFSSVIPHVNTIYNVTYVTAWNIW